MVSNKIIINNNERQKYKTIFDQKSGLLCRIENENASEPFWCEHGPELIDISITNWCDRNCSFCYRKSNRNGNQLTLTDYRIILSQAAQMGVLQVALGGGNPNQHSDFCEILRITREEYNIVPSYTTNGRGLTKEILNASKKYCGAVAVSAYEPNGVTLDATSKLINNGIRTNIHFLLTSSSIDTAIEWMQNPPELLTNINALIFLNYKPVGNTPNNDLLVKNSQQISKFFQLANEAHHYKIGFDSCSISAIARFMKTNEVFIDHCEAGRFSMFISEDMKMYPCSFMVDKVEGIPILKNNIQYAWKFSSIFKKIRESIKNQQCLPCNVNNICQGGCPIFKEINIC